jgi:hypothetical protein
MRHWQEHTRADATILLANYRKGGLEAFALQKPRFSVLVVGKADHEHRKTDVLRGPAAPQPPLASMPAVPCNVPLRSIPDRLTCIYFMLIQPTSNYPY